MKEHRTHAQAIGIIGGADGPTSVFRGGKNIKRPLRVRLRLWLHRQKRKLAARRITPGAHTMEELLAYAKARYGATQTEQPGTYLVAVDDSCLTLELDLPEDTFGVSFSGSRKAMRQFRKIVRDLYRYYGVTRKDMENQTRRYLTLLSILSM